MRKFSGERMHASLQCTYDLPELNRQTADTKKASSQAYGPVSSLLSKLVYFGPFSYLVKSFYILSS